MAQYLKGNDPIGDTAIFDWTMMGGSVFQPTCHLGICDVVGMALVPFDEEIDANLHGFRDWIGRLRLRLVRLVPDWAHFWKQIIKKSDSKWLELLFSCFSCFLGRIYWIMNLFFEYWMIHSLISCAPFERWVCSCDSDCLVQQVFQDAEQNKREVEPCWEWHASCLLFFLNILDLFQNSKVREVSR